MLRATTPTHGCLLAHNNVLIIYSVVERCVSKSVKLYSYLSKNTKYSVQTYAILVQIRLEKSFHVKLSLQYLMRFLVARV
jgi:hypothetical protein